MSERSERDPAGHDPVDELEETRWGGKLPSLSPSGHLLRQMREGHDLSGGALVGVIRSDRKLAEQMVALARCCERREGETLDTIERVVKRFDATSLRDSALALGLAGCNRVGTCEGFNYDHYWSKSLARALAAMGLAVELGWEEPLEAFALGLLATVGRLALAGAFPSDYVTILEELKGDTHERRLELEREAFGVDHVSMTDMLLNHLGFDVRARRAVQVFGAHADQDSESDALPPDASGLLIAASRVAHAFVARGDARIGVWYGLVNLRHGLELEREAFNQLGDRIANLWWEWGDRMLIPTTHVPAFSELSQRTNELDESAQLAGAARAETVPEDEPPSASLNILVVDDDPVSLRLLKSHLISGGHNVKTAVDGKEALLSALDETPQVIVADWVMPSMDGLELCKALRRFEAGRRILFILVTGKEEEEKIIEAFEAGVDDFIQKPVRPKPFLARVRAAHRVIELQHELDAEQRRLREELGHTKLLTKQLRMASMTDPLTELPNRRYAIKRLADEWANSNRTGSPLAAIMIDVDCFKAINDTYGHDVGDKVLRETAHVLEKETRKGEAACRLGGEEFLVICWNTGVNEASHCAERLRRAVQDNVVRAGNFEGNVTVSVGAAYRTERVESVDHLLKLADDAVYEAKRLGRNRVVLSDPEGGELRDAS